MSTLPEFEPESPAILHVGIPVQSTTGRAILCTIVYLNVCMYNFVQDRITGTLCNESKNGPEYVASSECVIFVQENTTCDESWVGR